MPYFFAHHIINVDASNVAVEFSFVASASRLASAVYRLLIAEVILNRFVDESLATRNVSIM